VLTEVKLNAKHMENEINELVSCLCNEDVDTVYVESDILYTYFRFRSSECGIVLNSNLGGSKSGDWIFYTSDVVDSTKNQFVCGNSMGSLYKSE
jgi:hypothetical protein